MIDLAKLKIFVYAAESLNFSTAGKHLHLTQPTVSHHIKSLEETLGVALFVRSGHTLKLTEAGRVLLPRAHKLIHQSLEVQEVMDSLQQKIIGHLRIACSTTAGKYVLPLLAARFCQRYPGIKISIMACSSENIIHRLLEEEVNLAVVSSYDLCGHEWECQEFFMDYVRLIVPPEHPWTRREVITPDDLLAEQIIMRENNSGTRRMLLTELAKHDISIDDLNTFLEIGNAEAIVKTVQAGYGVSFVSTLAAENAQAQGKVKMLPVAGLQLQRKIYMLRHALANPNRPQEVFWGYVHDPANADLLHLPGRF